MLREGSSYIAAGLALFALFLGNFPLFMLAFILGALASGYKPSPYLNMAVVKGMNFTRGKLGDIGFRQQMVKEGNGNYRRRTVAFKLPETVSNPRTLGQVRQRTKFKMIQAIGSALSAKGITYSFYRSGRGISGYNAFIRDGIASAIVEAPDGTPYVDWKKLQVTNGDFYKKMKPYQAQTLLGDDCNCARLLTWNYDWTCDPDGNAYALNLIGVKVDEEGAIEDVVCVQPRIPLSACHAEVLLPQCDCCKTYWYAFFVDPYTGYFSSSEYIGTCDCSLPVYEGECGTCVTPPPAPSFTPPSECPTHCGDGTNEVNRTEIVYTGLSKVPNGYLRDSPLIYPACPLLRVEAMVEEDHAYTTALASLAQNGLYQIKDANGMIVSEFMGTNDANDWREGGIAYTTMMNLGYHLQVDVADNLIKISATDGRILSSIQVDVENDGSLHDFSPEQLMSTVLFIPHPIDAMAELVVKTSNGTTIFHGDPSTLPDGILTIQPSFEAGAGSIIYTVKAVPKDGACPNVVATYEFDGDQLEMLSGSDMLQTDALIQEPTINAVAIGDNDASDPKVEEEPN